MSGNTYPEQDFVYEWAKKHNVELERSALLEIIDRMTNPRLELQDIRARLNKYFSDNNMI